MECVQRFNYVEKAEYWALVWGTAVMIVTGIMLWFDNWFIQFLPKGVLDVALVIHFWEAWLASLAILVWHLYSVIFHPHVYPMNPSWITGNMPDEMYEPSTRAISRRRAAKPKRRSAASWSGCGGGRGPTTSPQTRIRTATRRRMTSGS